MAHFVANRCHTPVYHVGELKNGPGRSVYSSYGDKKKLAAWINGDMAKLGLNSKPWE